MDLPLETHEEDENGGVVAEKEGDQEEAVEEPTVNGKKRHQQQSEDEGSVGSADSLSDSSSSDDSSVSSSDSSASSDGESRKRKKKRSSGKKHSRSKNRHHKKESSSSKRERADAKLGDVSEEDDDEDDELVITSPKPRPPAARGEKRDSAGIPKKKTAASKGGASVAGGGKKKAAAKRRNKVDSETKAKKKRTDELNMIASLMSPLSHISKLINRQMTVEGFIHTETVRTQKCKTPTSAKFVYADHPDLVIVKPFDSSPEADAERKKLNLWRDQTGEWALNDMHLDALSVNMNEWHDFLVETKRELEELPEWKDYIEERIQKVLDLNETVGEKNYMKPVGADVAFGTLRPEWIEPPTKVKELLQKKIKELRAVDSNGEMVYPSSIVDPDRDIAIFYVPAYNATCLCTMLGMTRAEFRAGKFCFELSRTQAVKMGWLAHILRDGSTTKEMRRGAIPDTIWMQDMVKAGYYKNGAPEDIIFAKPEKRKKGGGSIRRATTDEDRNLDVELQRQADVFIDSEIATRTEVSRDRTF